MSVHHVVVDEVLGVFTRLLTGSVGGGAIGSATGRGSGRSGGSAFSQIWVKLRAAVDRTLVNASATNRRPVVRPVLAL